jgi:hypothetical protein
MDNLLDRLYQFIAERYDLEELRTLCFSLGVRYDDLGGEGLGAKIRELILKLGRQGSLDRLLAQLQQDHPKLLDQAGFEADHATLDALYAALPAFELPKPQLHFKMLLGVSFVAVVLLGFIAALLISTLGKSSAPTNAPTAVSTPNPSVAGSDIGVVVAKFGLSDDVDSEEADLLVERFSNLLERELTDALDDARLTVGFIGSSQVSRIAGANASEREDDARRLAADYGASIVVYGFIRRHEVTGQIELQPEFYVAPPSFTDALEMTGAFRFGSHILVNEPLRDALEAESILSERTIALAHVMAGLSQYARGNYTGAQTAFERALNVPVWADADGKEVVHVLLGNTYVKMAQQAATQCERDQVLTQLDYAAAEYDVARSLALDYSRAYAGLASVTYLSALWIREENDACANQLLDLERLEEVLSLVGHAQRVPDQPKEISVATKVLFTQAQALFSLWNTESAFAEDEYAQFYQDFWDTSERIIRNYENGDYPAVAPIAIETYGLRGAMLQNRGEYRAAIEQYDLGLQIDSIDPARQMLFIGWKGDSYAQLGQLTLAAEAYTQALQIAKAIDDPKAVDYYTSQQTRVDNELLGRPTATLPSQGNATATPALGALAWDSQVASVRKSAPPNTLRGVSFGLGGAISVVNNEKCNQASAGISGVMATGYRAITTYASGDVIQVSFEHPYGVSGMAVDNPFAFPEKPYMWVWEGFVAPRICASMPVQAIAISPGGQQHTPSIIRYELPDTQDFSLNEVFVVRLPLEAYAQPGLWQLVVQVPSHFELGIKIPYPDRPLYLREGERFVLMGFEPYEQLMGVVFGAEEYVFKGDFNLQANEQGAALIELEGVNGPVFFVGESGNVITNVSSNWWEPPVGGSSFGELLFSTYWDESTLEAARPISATVAFSETVLYAEPSAESTVVGQLSSEQRVTLVGRDWRGKWVQLSGRDNSWVSTLDLDLEQSVFNLPVTVDVPEETRDFNLKGTLNAGEIVSSVTSYDHAYLPGDAWTFSGDAGTLINLQAKNIGTGGAPEDWLTFVPQLDLYGPDGSLLAEGDIIWEALIGQLSNLALPESGTYTLIVRPYGPAGEAPAYELSLSAITAKAQEIAGQLLYGDTMSSESEKEGDGELWTFLGHDGDVVSISVDGEADLALYNPAGTVEASGDEISGYQLAGTGTHAVLVTNPAGGVYTISLALQLDTVDLEEYRTLRYGETITGELPSSSESNVFHQTWRFEGRSEDQVTIEVDSLSSDVFVDLYGPEGNLLTCKNSSDGSNTVKTCLLPGTGQYVILIYTLDENINSYQLTLKGSR